MSKKDRLIEVLLVAGISLMPYTSFKVLGPIGPAEIMMLVLFFIALQDKKWILEIDSNPIGIMKYLLAYIVICACGTIWNFLFSYITSTEISFDKSSFLFDMLSYFFNLMTVYAMESLRSHLYSIGPKKIIKEIVLVSFVSMLLLYMISRVRTSLFGMPLIYAGRYFTPLATNLHHTSMFIMPLGFWTIYIAESEQQKLNKLMFYGIAVFFLYLATQTGSTKATMGSIFGVIICLFYKLTTQKGVLNDRAIVAMTIIGIIVVVIGAANFDIVKEKAIAYFVENDLGGGRQSIWSAGIQKWLESPVLGFGFGMHSDTGEAMHDAHNTFLTAMLQGGTLGLLVFGTMWIRIICKSISQGYILAMCMSVFIYISGGDVLRRIPIWCFAVLACVCIEQQKKNEQWKDINGQRTFDKPFDSQHS